MVSAECLGGVIDNKFQFLEMYLPFFRLKPSTSSGMSLSTATLFQAYTSKERMKKISTLPAYLTISLVKHPQRDPNRPQFFSNPLIP